MLDVYFPPSSVDQTMSGNDAQDPYDEEYLVAEGEQLMVSIASWIDSSFFCVCFLFGFSAPHRSAIAALKVTLN